MSEKEEVIPAFVWREKTTKATLNSIDIAIRVLEDRIPKFTEDDRKLVLELAQNLIDLAKPVGNCKQR